MEDQQESRSFLCIETQKSYIDQKGSFQWIQNGELQFDEERLLFAAQDQGLTTNGFLKMCGLRQDDKCRFSHTAIESTSHLVSGCQTLLADGHYTRRHNKVCTYLHWALCQDKKKHPYTRGLAPYSAAYNRYRRSNYFL